MNADASSWIGKIQQKYARAWCKWDSKEDEILTTLYKQGLPLEDICAKLQRGKGGVVKRLEVLGLENKSTPKNKYSRLKKPGIPVPQLDAIPLGDHFFPDEKCLKETAAIWHVPSRILHKSLGSLSDHQRIVFILRYGLRERCSYSLNGIAKLLQTQSDNVAQIQKTAEARVRLFLEQQGFVPVLVSLRETLSRQLRKFDSNFQPKNLQSV